MNLKFWKTKSRLSQARGLKHSVIDKRNKYVDVAPFTGAWIETKANKQTTRKPGVAPFTGAWIETLSLSCNAEILASRLSQARGLKQSKIDELTKLRKSRLSQARGLKPKTLVKVELE